MNYQFKSYYVVWKRDYLSMHTDMGVRLNRTMQYGNSHRRLVKMWRKQFKSYYVVWKPSSTSFSFSCVDLFKSYYVVWKPTSELSLSLSHISFKSYYVVWKHISVGQQQFPYYSLNRTMQYGNNNFDINKHAILRV